MHEMYQLVFPPKTFVVNPRGNQLVAKLRLGNVSIEDVKQAFSRISSEHTFTVRHDDTNTTRGYVARVETDAPKMTDVEISELLTEFNAHLKRIKRREITPTDDLVDLTISEASLTSSGSSHKPKPKYVNRKHS